MSLIIPGTFQHILRVMNTNIDGKRNIMFAMTAIKGCGRRYANLVLKKVSLLFHLWVDALKNCRILYSGIRIIDIRIPAFTGKVKWPLLIWVHFEVMELEENKCVIDQLFKDIAKLSIVRCATSPLRWALVFIFKCVPLMLTDADTQICSSNRAKDLP